MGEFSKVIYFSRDFVMRLRLPLETSRGDSNIRQWAKDFRHEIYEMRNVSKLLESVIPCPQSSPPKSPPLPSKSPSQVQTRQPRRHQTKIDNPFLELRLP